MRHSFETYGGMVIRLIGRGSRLSVLQMECVKSKILEVFPGAQVQLVFRGSTGDALPDVPLHTVEGSDFFTRDIFEALAAGEADIAVHSLKDMSSEHFFGENKFAVVDRDDARDVAILGPGTKSKINRGEALIAGTCSPRREMMAVDFLKKALPGGGKQPIVETRPIRGNVDTRLRKLDAGEYDAIILASAGLNRLLRSEQDAPLVRDLVSNKSLILLPLVECVPAPCQGAIVAEAHPSNELATRVLNAIKDAPLTDTCVKERETARQYGVGCLQRFGVTTISYGRNSVQYAAGIDSGNQRFSTWTGLPRLDIAGKRLFSATDSMGSFFNYRYTGQRQSISENIIYVANYKAVESGELVNHLKEKRVWAAGTKTWLELAKKGIWVEGSADAFGLEFLQEAWRMPLFNISREEVAVVTNEQSAKAWREKGWKAYGTYLADPKDSDDIRQQLKTADVIFWTSFRQFEQYRDLLQADVVHSCPFGETASQFRSVGIEPVVFPNIKAFQQWRETSTQ